MLRIGQGYDAHRFKEGGQLVLGGVAIDYEKSLAATRMEIVALHALCDALLGAAALGDIGCISDSDPVSRDRQSCSAPWRPRQIVERGYSVCNVDLTIVAKTPVCCLHRKDALDRRE